MMIFEAPNWPRFHMNAYIFGVKRSQASAVCISVFRIISELNCSAQALALDGSAASPKSTFTNLYKIAFQCVE